MHIVLRGVRGRGSVTGIVMDWYVECCAVSLGSLVLLTWFSISDSRLRLCLVVVVVVVLVVVVVVVVFWCFLCCLVLRAPENITRVLSYSGLIRPIRPLCGVTRSPNLQCLKTSKLPAVVLVMVLVVVVVVFVVVVAV